AYLRATPSVRDVVVSGGDVANLPIKQLERFVSALLDIDTVRDVRLATKGLMVLPQHFLQPDVQEGLGRLARKARQRGVDVAVHEALALQHAIMGYLPGFATPRVVCDVPFVGKRWVHQVEGYDRDLGISYWTKNYRTGIEFDDTDALNKRYPYYDPIRTLPESGKDYWRARVAAGDLAPA